MPSLQELNNIRSFYSSGATLTYDSRKGQLQNLKRCLQKYEHEIYAALHSDLKKSPEECWVTENGFLLAEINYILKNLRSWMQPENVNTNLLNIPSSSFIMKEPLGVVLVIGPWNYPLQLLFTPLAGAIAAGNCVVLKPSEFAPATSALMKKIVAETFDPAYVFFAEGEGSVVIPAMMNEFVFDHVFYTGSTAVGKIIYQLAAKDLVPVTLELGGKSPAVVEAEVNLKVAAKRIALAKFSNAGQMCVAPDYVLVHISQKDKLLAEFKKILLDFFGTDAAANENYGKIINEKQFDRLLSYLDTGNVIAGGMSDRSNLFLEPTIMDGIDLNSPLMKDEIFGPILPVISFTNREEALAVISANKNPLAFYLFTSDAKTEKDWLASVAFGGGCVNNASWHLTNHHLPFGGRGFSGTGSYHGKFSFDTFSHKKSVMKTPTWFDPAIKYPPFKGKLKLFKWVIR